MPWSVIAGDVIVGEFRSAALDPCWLPRAFDRLRESEVEHLDAAVGADLDVGGLEIAMDDALIVRGLERFSDLPRHRDRLVDGQRAVRQSRREFLALDQLHGDRAAHPAAVDCATSSTP